MCGLKRLALSLMSAMLVVACGGGGGGSSDSALPQASLKYAGATTQATINSGNASTLTTKALSAQDDAMAGGGSARMPGANNAIDIAKSLALSGLTKSSRAATTRDTQMGSCGGTVTTTQTGSNSGVLTFSTYCQGMSGSSVTMSGTVVFSATTATAGSTQYVSALSMSFIDVSVTQQPGNDVFVLAGSTALTFDSTSNLLNMTVSFVVQDSSGKTLWLDNYVIDENTYPGYVAVHGRLYHPDHGYVTITTTQPLLISGKWPSAGQIVIDGAANTHARLTAYSTGYTIAIDSGSGYGAESTLIPWPVN